MSIIEIKELRALRGPNRYTKHSAILMALDIKTYESRPSNTIKNFRERLLKHIPTLKAHKCSIGTAGGFVQRLKQGTWAGHIIEHIAIELQCLAGMDVRYGKTFCTLQEGVYVVVFRYLVESAGLKAATKATAIYEALAEGKDVDIHQIILELKILGEKDRLGPTTHSIVEEAKSRDIPFIRLNKNSYIQLGHGVHQKRIQASMSHQTSAIAVEVADEKMRTKAYLKKSGIPVPQGHIVSNQQDAMAAFTSIGGAVVVKPNVGNHGRGITINVTDMKQLKEAFLVAQKIHDEVVIEAYVQGFDFRLLVINGKLVAAAKREPAHVIGDGKYSLQKLIEKENENPNRGMGHENTLTKIDTDASVEHFLSLVGLKLSSIPKKGDRVYLKATANLSQGGTATDVTDEVHPQIQSMAERAARIIGLDCMGIDVLAKNLSLPLKSSGLNVVEVNAAPGFRMHLKPSKGQARNVAIPFVNMLFPKGYTQAPIIAVTGTNGKTTTCKLIAHTLKYFGKCVGLACTTGIEIDGNSIVSGDYSGPEGAEIVLRETTVDHIVLEAARGGIVRRGMGVDKVDVGVLLNIGNDHMGTDWIESQEDLNLVKSTVIEAVKTTGSSVLNADDPMAMSVIERAKGKIILFSLDPQHQKLKQHVDEGGEIVTLNKRSVIIAKKGLSTDVCTLEEIPITFGGIVGFNISNALAAIAALHALHVPTAQIRNGMMTFYPSPSQNPGRMNLFDFQGYKVLVDYAHNPESAHALAKFLPHLSTGRKIALCHGTGSRTDKQIVEFGEALSPLYDQIILTDFDPRHRPLGETIKLIKQGLIAGGFQEANIEIAPDSTRAVDHLFSKAKTGDLLIIHPNDLETVMNQVMEKHRKMTLSEI